MIHREVVLSYRVKACLLAARRIVIVSDKPHSELLEYPNAPYVSLKH